MSAVLQTFVSLSYLDMFPTKIIDETLRSAGKLMSMGKVWGFSESFFKATS